ncbi:hypothetical protein VNI00_014164 [Paramarasmius palmivorus]|uniref:Fungal-type protein kinase domain-containing protein n=1 Tax=Paramarasmius palmivorus TaxID=297713 RepID=A0AAW0BUC2_9AGAR
MKLDEPPTLELNWSPVWATAASARLLRWDRGGVVFTKKFNYIKEPWLVELLWKFNHADAETRGYDESVTVPGEEEAVHVERAKMGLGLAADSMVYEVKENYGVSLATKSSLFPVGCWSLHKRLRSRRRNREGLFEGCMQNHGIRLLGGTISVQFVGGYSTYFRCSSGWRCRRKVAEDSQSRMALGGAWCQRSGTPALLLKEVGIPLIQFSDTRQLMRDALEAYADVYEKDTLHRDIGTGNILINPKAPKEGGLLVDWEFAWCINNAGAHIVERTDLQSHLRAVYGSWQLVDEGTVEKGEVVGGRGKKNCSYVAVHGDRGRTAWVIVALEAAFATRCRKPPTQAQRAAFQEMVEKYKPILEDLVNLNPLVFVNDVSMEKLEPGSPQWMLDLFSKALEDPRGLIGKPVHRSFLTTSHDRVQATVHVMSDRVVARP